MVVLSFRSGGLVFASEGLMSEETLSKHVGASVRNMSESRWYTLFTALFAHGNLLHLTSKFVCVLWRFVICDWDEAVNMATLVFVGYDLLLFVSPTSYMVVYIGDSLLDFMLMAVMLTQLQLED